MPMLLGDERRLKQVLINLIRNAIKFTKMGSIKIWVEYEQSPSSILSVKVKDTGVGIEEEDLQRLFTRFGKLQRTAAINSEGLGLGLTIVKQIVEMTGGRVWVTSRGVNRGSTFFFTMHLDEEEHDQLVIRDPEQQEDTIPLSSYISENAVEIDMVSDWGETSGSVLLGREIRKRNKDNQMGKDSKVVEQEAEVMN